MQTLPRVCSKMWMMISSPVMSNFYHLGFHSINIEQHILRLCLLLNALGHNYCIPRLWLLSVLTEPLTFIHTPPAGRTGKGPTDRVRVRKVLLLMQGMSVPHLAQLKASLWERDITTSIRAKGEHPQEEPVGSTQQWSQKPWEIGMTIHRGLCNRWHTACGKGWGGDCLTCQQ